MLMTLMSSTSKVVENFVKKFFENVLTLLNIFDIMNITKQERKIMNYTTIDEKSNLVLGYDVTGKEYFVWDKTNSKWQWFKSLSQAKNYFDTIIDYLNRIK